MVGGWHKKLRWTFKLNIYWLYYFSFWTPRIMIYKHPCFTTSTKILYKNKWKQEKKEEVSGVVRKLGFHTISSLASSSICLTMILQVMIVVPALFGRSLNLMISFKDVTSSVMWRKATNTYQVVRQQRRGQTRHSQLSFSVNPLLETHYICIHLLPNPTAFSFLPSITQGCLTSTYLIVTLSEWKLNSVNHFKEPVNS